MSSLRVAGWLAIPKEGFDASRLKSKLSIAVTASSMSQSDEASIVRLYREDASHVYIPRQAGFLPADVIQRAIDCTAPGDPRDFGSEFTLRPYQTVMADNFLRKLDTHPYGGMVCAAAGAGKTVLGLELMRRIGRTTLVLVHKEFLVKQWTERIRSFLPAARIGYIQQDRCDYGDEYDVVIGMIQSLVIRKYPRELYDWPGVVIVDEVHRTGAETFVEAAPQFSAKIRIGLTATPRRKDGMEPAFFWHIGPILASVPRENTKTMPPAVRIMKFPNRYNMARYVMRNGKFNLSKWVTDASARPERNELIVTTLVKALEKGRRVIVLSHRLEHLRVLKDMVAAAAPTVVSDYYIGGMRGEALEKASGADLLLATYAMAAEGLDIPPLDCVFLVTPTADVEQAVGRVQRFVEGKKQPIVVDIVDTGMSIAIALGEKRRQIYAKLGATYV